MDTRESLQTAWEAINPSNTLDDELATLLLIYMNSRSSNRSTRLGGFAHKPINSAANLAGPPQRFARSSQSTKTVPAAQSKSFDPSATQIPECPTDCNGRDSLQGVGSDVSSGGSNASFGGRRQRTLSEGMEIPILMIFTTNNEY
jgi:hypothetical protein